MSSACGDADMTMRALMAASRVLSLRRRSTKTGRTCTPHHHEHVRLACMLNTSPQSQPASTNLAQQALQVVPEVGKHKTRRRDGALLDLVVHMLRQARHGRLVQHPRVRGGVHIRCYSFVLSQQQACAHVSSCCKQASNGA